MINSIPLEVIQNRNLSILESIVWFLKEQEKMNFHNIGVMLNRDERNIWTVYSRAKKKIVCFQEKETNSLIQEKIVHTQKKNNLF